jgi:hypothetical protein
MYIKGLFITALAALTAHAAKVRQMTTAPATYVQTETAAGSFIGGGSSSGDDDSYCFRNTGCISTRWDQQIQEKHNPSICEDFCVTIDNFLCPDCECDGTPDLCQTATVELGTLPNYTIARFDSDPSFRTITSTITPASCGPADYSVNYTSVLPGFTSDANRLVISIDSDGVISTTVLSNL